jgi:hypothetical protein
VCFILERVQDCTFSDDRRTLYLIDIPINDKWLKIVGSRDAIHRLEDSDESPFNPSGRNSTLEHDDERANRTDG